ncbi:16S rRNA (cytosine(967)-C(5))-methyltransferase RsmB [Ramlibacter albus]|uniref:16S rRNA (cytosine(967)-C(5))-methyltransferase n=1 Tax=Ramlibacter albus TaxID=2079448 RepID=A0A923S1W9_9BURK|nr:16S rRNA (cytosine(967)-C(5))-methyltransferase RsmB [Ramlibacter albus]MBC5764138.1 16S rRNA (cytosine(967)-C(5))-methyltransferase RsmB [Ramlibacter albus]
MIALWQQLQTAASVVAAVRAGESATPALARIAGDVRAGAQSLAFHALRNLGRAEALRKQLANRPPPPKADALLCTAIALAWDEANAPYEPFTLVDQAVEAAKRSPETKAQANFINACLRRLLRERDALVAATDNDPVAKWNHPKWWIARLKQDHPQQWQAILEANNSAAPLTLRVNARKSTRDDYLAQVEGTPVGEQGVILAKPKPVHEIPGFAEGVVSVQDAGAQLAGTLVAQHAPNARRILDACAAPGGKTAHIAELLDSELIALDVDPTRCERIHDNLRRLGLHATVLAEDAANTAKWWDGVPFDAILLDAPCTASGIVRRHPDVRWLRRESDITSLAQQQQRLLTSLWPLLAPGGALIYCTCSVFKAEGEAQIQSFLSNNKEAFLMPSPGHLLPQNGGKPGAVRDNGAGDHDGFFYGVVGKRG